MNAIIIENPLAGVADMILRRATPEDEPQIRTLVRAEKLNPTGLHYPAFHVVSFEGMIVGAAQIRRHRDGSREFGSLVVAPDFRGRGIGRALIHALLSQERERLHVITTPGGAKSYERLGFRRVPGRAAPAAVWRNLRIGQLVGVLSRLRGRRPLRLCVLERPAREWLLPQPAFVPRTSDFSPVQEW
jgi:amino-acid N-acetyltransferase